MSAIHSAPTMETLQRETQPLSGDQRYRALLAVSEAIVSHRDLSVLFHALSLKETEMSRLLSTLIAGTFAIRSAYAVADGMVDVQKQAELDKIIATGQSNAQLRGAAIARSAATSASQPRVSSGASAHERALDNVIASGNHKGGA